MSLGLVGAHRVGKSTLAEAYSNDTDVPLLLTQSVDVFKELGISPDANLAFNQRLDVQKRILDRAEQQYRAEKEYFVADRTPVDMLAYTQYYLAKCSPLNDLQLAAYERYRKDCISVTNNNFTTLVLVQPGIKLVDEPGKAASCKMFQQTLNALMMGLMFDNEMECFRRILAPNVLHLKDRVEALHAAESDFVDHLLGMFDDNSVLLH